MFLLLLFFLTFVGWWAEGGMISTPLNLADSSISCAKLSFAAPSVRIGSADLTRSSGIHNKKENSKKIRL